MSVTAEVLRMRYQKKKMSGNVTIKGHNGNYTSNSSSFSYELVVKIQVVFYPFYPIAIHAPAPPIIKLCSRSHRKHPENSYHQILQRGGAFRGVSK